MGMFDYIRCEYPMPEGYEWAQKVEFQTKDLECQLDYYTIDKSGRIEAVGLGDACVNGDVRFYGCEREPPDGGRWIELVAHFDHGQLTSLVVDPEERFPVNGSGLVVPS